MIGTYLLLLPLPVKQDSSWFVASRMSPCLQVDTALVPGLLCHREEPSWSNHAALLGLVSGC
jgi:hypothetical protein